MPIPLAQRETLDQAPQTDQSLSQGFNLAKNILKPIAENVINSEKLETNNILNDAQNEIMVFNSKFKVDNSSDPFNKDETKEYNSEIERVYAERRETIPSLYLKEYDNAFLKFKKKNDINIDTWKVSQNEKNIITDTTIGLQTDFNSAYRLGEEGNLFDAINYFENKEDLINENITGLNPQTHNQIYGSYKSDFFTNFVSGSMNNNPENTLILLNNEKIKAGIDPETYSKLKVATENKLLNAKSLSIKKEISSKIISNTRETRKAIEGKSSYTELYNYIQTNEISKPTADYLMKIGGYKKAGVKAKIPISEQIKAKNEIYNKIELAVAKGEIKDFEKIQNEIYQKADGGFFSQKESETMIDTYITPYAEKVQEATEDYAIKRIFEFGLNIGSRGINEFVDELQVPEKGEKTRRASIRVGLLDSFTDELNQEILANPDIDNIKDLDSLKKTERIRIFNIARDNAIKNYAQDLGIQTENRPLNDIKHNIKQTNINAVRKDNFDVIDNTYKRTQTRSFTSVAFFNGKYLGLTPEGNEVEITQKEYQDLRGKK